MGRGVIAAACAAAAVGCAESGRLTVADAYSPLPPTPDVAAVYAVIVNPTSRPDTLWDVAAPGAQRAELHRQVTEGGMMFQMEPVEALLIPARDSVPLVPGSLHVMLFGLARQPAAGDTLELVFRFRHAGDVPAPVRVRSRAELSR